MISIQAAANINHVHFCKLGALVRKLQASSHVSVKDAMAPWTIRKNCRQLVGTCQRYRMHEHLGHITTQHHDNTQARSMARYLLTSPMRRPYLDSNVFCMGNNRLCFQRLPCKGCDIIIMEHASRMEGLKGKDNCAFTTVAEPMSELQATLQETNSNPGGFRD